MDVRNLAEAPIMNGTFLLLKSIPALQMVAMENGRERWGPLTRLSIGSELHMLGDGFDGQTLRVRLDGFIYIVFRQDLECAYEPSTLAATA
jgi:hypothetical protein